jgi:hypothetical protein
MYAQWCERRTSSLASGETVYSIANAFVTAIKLLYSTYLVKHLEASQEKNIDLNFQLLRHRD